MRKLSNTDYVIWDKTNDTLMRFHSNSDIVIYGNIEEAQEDCYTKEWVTKCTDLPEHHKEELIYQINKDIDLFEHYDLIPDNIKSILDKYSETYSYTDCASMLAEIESQGYTFDYGLDAQPYNLRPNGHL